MRECILLVSKIGGLRVGLFIISCMGCLLCVRAQFGLTHAPLIGHFHGFCNMYGPQHGLAKKGSLLLFGQRRHSRHAAFAMAVTPLNDQLHLNSFNLI